MKSLLIILLFFICIISGYSQNYPFPQNSVYKYGIHPANRNHTDADTVYTNWKIKHITAQGAGGYRRVLWDTLNATVSEGIGYGMLISVNMNDRTLFDDLWGYYNLHLDPNGLMNWIIDSLGNPLFGLIGSATDAEEDVAYALILADRQWGSSGSNNYIQSGINLINKIFQYEIDTVFNLPKSGDEPGSIYRVNASYFAPAYYRAFGYYSGNSGWDSVITGCYNFLFFINNDTTGLVPDWCLPNGTPMPPCPPPYSCRYTYYYDATRTPWRISMDFLWYGNSYSNSFCSLISSFARRTGSLLIKDEYTLSGLQTGIYHNNAFLGPFGAGSMATNSSFRNFCDSIYSENVNTYSTRWNYYNSSLKLLSLLIQTGNFIPLYPKTPVLISPPDNSVNNPPDILLDWQKIIHADFYRVQISADSSFGSLILDSNNIQIDSIRIASGILIQGIKYYWRVKAYNYFGDGRYSGIRNFRISVTGIIKTENDVPGNFMLYGCYPNPFNGSSAIMFDIPEITFADISIFDISGRKLTDIAHALYKAGRYRILLDLSGFPSGVYFCRFGSARYTNSIKLLLIK